MKKKTRLRSSNSLLVPFILGVSISFMGAVVSSGLFYNSFFRSLTKMNESPIATITFKYRTAERKFLERTVWDRLRQNSPLYNGDTIHTDRLSEATIHYSDGNILELGENSMAQVFVTEDEVAQVQVHSGSAVVDTSQSQNGMTVTSGGMDVAVSSGGSVAVTGADEEGGAGQVQVITGRAEVTTEGKTLSVSEGQGVAVQNSSSRSSGGRAEIQVVVTSPKPGSKFLSTQEGGFLVLFKWNITDSAGALYGSENKLLLQVADSKKFSSVVYESGLSAGRGQQEVSLLGGAYWWRIVLIDSNAGERVLAQNRVQVVESLPPKLLSPQEGAVISYRNKIPGVRLIWGESQLASTYRLEVCDNESFASPIVDMRTQSTSAIVSTLKAGTWYWRVTPFYTLNKIGFTASSQTGRFSIERKISLDAPRLFVPANKAIVDSKRNSGALNFSWKADAEALSYTLTISRNSDLRGGKKFESTENYFSLPNDFELQDGEWYWSVVTNADGGVKSPESDARLFYAMRGKPEQHTVEPSDGYEIAQNLLPDMNFTWKRNMPQGFTSRLQVSNDSNFSRIVFSAPAEGNGGNVSGLGVGTYYWRLLSTDGTTEAATVPKSFRVLGSLDKTDLISPAKQGRAVARETRPFTFEWTPVEGADYYRVEILSAGKRESVWRDIIYGTTVDIDMFNGEGFEDRANYEIEIQAFSNAVPGVASRRTGMLFKSIFNLVKLRPVSITAPEKGARISGLDMIMKPPYASWSSVEEVSFATFTVTKVDSAPPELVLQVPSDYQISQGNRIAPNRVLLDTRDGIREGNYEIVVRAETLDGIDISNTAEKYKGRFTVLPVPPLELAQGLNPVPQVFDSNYLLNRNNPRTVKFEWAKVKDANDYQIIIKKTRRGKVIYSAFTGGKTNFVLDFVTKDSKLDEAVKKQFFNGKFVWCIRAVRRIDTDKDGKVDKILQQSPESYSNFETDIPVPKKARAKGASNPYGR